MAYHTCNPMTCAGFGNTVFGGCSMFWIGMVIIFFAAAFGRKYLGEMGGAPFSFPGALLGGYGAYVIISVFTCSYKFGLVGGLIGMGVLGIALAPLFGGGD